MKGKGQSFDDFLKEEGMLEIVQEESSKRLIAYQLQEEMKKQRITKSEVAKKMNTSRTAVDNILNPTFNTSLDSLESFARAIGKKLVVSIQ